MSTMYVVYTKLPRMTQRKVISGHNICVKDGYIDKDMELLLDVFEGKYEYEEGRTLVDYKGTLYRLEEFRIKSQRMNSIQARLVCMMNKDCSDIVHELAEAVRELISQGAVVKAKPLQ